MSKKILSLATGQPEGCLMEMLRSQVSDLFSTLKLASLTAMFPSGSQNTETLVFHVALAEHFAYDSNSKEI